MQKTMAPTYIIFFLGTLSVLLFQITDCDVAGKIKLLKFENKENKDFKGNYCDSLIIKSLCDTLFGLNISSRLDTSCLKSTSCLYHVKSTIPISSSTGIVEFQKTNTSLPDIIEVNWKIWTGGFQLMLNATDNDSITLTDLIDIHNVTIQNKPHANHSVATFTTVKSSGVRNLYKTLFVFQYMLFCTNSYYGENCSTFCNGKAFPKQYICDQNGRKICLHGWYGKECSRYCLREENSTGHYTCSGDGRKLCNPGWTGANCDNFIPMTTIETRLTGSLIAYSLTKSSLQENSSPITGAIVKTSSLNVFPPLSASSSCITNSIQITADPVITESKLQLPSSPVLQFMTTNTTISAEAHSTDCTEVKGYSLQSPYTYTVGNPDHSHSSMIYFPMETKISHLTGFISRSEIPPSIPISRIAVGTLSLAKFSNISAINFTSVSPTSWQMALLTKTSPVGSFSGNMSILTEVISNSLPPTNTTLAHTKSFSISKSLVVKSDEVVATSKTDPSLGNSKTTLGFSSLVHFSNMAASMLTLSVHIAEKKPFSTKLRGSNVNFIKNTSLLEGISSSAASLNSMTPYIGTFHYPKTKTVNSDMNFTASFKTPLITSTINNPVPQREDFLTEKTLMKIIIVVAAAVVFSLLILLFLIFKCSGPKIEMTNTLPRRCSESIHFSRFQDEIQMEYFHEQSLEKHCCENLPHFVNEGFAGEVINSDEPYEKQM